MNCLLLLSLVTLLSGWMQWRIWKKTRSLVLLLPVLVIFYWSILGGWVITIDLLTGNALEKLGFHYYAYFDKLFPIQLNHAYFKSLVLFSSFLLLFQAVVLRMVRSHSQSMLQMRPTVYLNHWLILAGSFAMAFISYLFIRAQITDAIAHHESLYLYLSHSNGRFYSLYQLTKSSSLFLLLFGVALLLSHRDGRYFTANSSKWLIVAYALGMILLLGYSALIGSRNDLLFAFIFGILFYLTNARKIRWILPFFQVVGLASVIVIIEMTRAIPILDYIGLSSGPGVPTGDVVKHMSVLESILSLLASNEMFAGHMSMYGVLYYEVPLTHGASFNYLLHSLLPRFVDITRPLDSYQHYVAGVGYSGLQGFTINHATGWYINFGFFGVALGAMLLALLVSAAYNVQQSFTDGGTLQRIARAVLLLSAASFFSALIRTGPEGLRALTFEAILIPMALLFVVAKLSALFSSASKT